MKALLDLGAPIAALITHRDDPREEVWWHSCTDLAIRHGIPVHYPEKIDDEWLARIATIRPAVIYSFFYRNLLPQRLLDLAPLGAYNLHGAMLPNYRGRASVNWVLVNGEAETGVTLHHMVARADAGDIVAQRAVQIEDRDTALTLYRKLVPIGARLLSEFHPLIVTGRAPRHPQDISQGCYFGRRRPEDGRIDWRWPARRIHNLVRAVTHPYPGAFTSRRAEAWSGRRESQRRGRRAEPGTMVGSSADGGIEMAAMRSINLIGVQFEGDVEGARGPGRSSPRRIDFAR